MYKVINDQFFNSCSQFFIFLLQKKLTTTIEKLIINILRIINYHNFLNYDIFSKFALFIFLGRIPIILTGRLK